MTAQKAPDQSRKQLESGIDPRLPANTTSTLGRGSISINGSGESWKAHLSSIKQGGNFAVVLPDGSTADGKVQLVVVENRIRRISGKLTVGTGTFLVGIEGDTIEGHIYFPETNRALILQGSVGGKVRAEEKPLSDVICTPYPRETLAKAESLREPDAQFSASVAEAAPLLESRPGAPAVIYLDFDGETVTDPDWNGGATIVAAASALYSSDINEVWARVKEDFIPFNINVTTDKTKYDAADAKHRTRVIITPSSSWYPIPAGGVALVDSFSLAGTVGHSATIPCWVFNTSIAGIAESISHEVGHTLGLHHDGRTNPVEEYFAGHGEGPVSWGPIMGAPYGKSVVQWSKGDYAYANRRDEDDIAIIASNKNGFGFVADDVGDTAETATSLAVTDTDVTGAGTIGSSSDVDFFKLVLPACSLQLYVGGASWSANLDIVLELQNQNGTVLATSNPDQYLDTSIYQSLPAGTYYLKIRGTGRGDIAGDGYVDGYPAYGSIGEYRIAGYIGAPPSAPTITSQPTSVNAYVGGPISLYVAADGSYPMSFQWQKDTVDIAGSNSNSLYIPVAKLTDSGVYRVIISNSAGSVTSANATVTVSTPPPPTISYEPSDQTLVADNSIYLSAGVSSVVPASCQWYKDGVPIAGATSSSYSKYHATIADSGKYKAVFTNSGGTASTHEALVTVEGAKIPVFTTQPIGAEVERGARYSFSVNATSNTPVTYQWYKGTTAIAGATSYYYIVDPVKDSDDGSYYATATTAGGTASSSSAKLTVIPPKLPVIYHSPTSQTVQLGSSTSFSTYVISSVPVTYQWYFNGVPISGAKYENLSVQQVSANNIGEYYVAVSNGAGTVESGSAMLDIARNGSPAASDWIDAQERDGIVYFLFQNPDKISRYDLASETWLGDWALSDKPTAFAIADDSIYVAFARTLYKFDTALGNKTTWANSPQNITSLAVGPSSVFIYHTPAYYSTVDIDSYSRSTTTKLATKSVSWSGKNICYNAITKKLYSSGTGYDADIKGIAINPDGTFGDETQGSGTTGSSTNSRVFGIADDQYVANEAGVINRASDLSPVGTLYYKVQDIVAGAAGDFIVLKGGNLISVDTSLRETGRFVLNDYYSRLWRLNSNVFMFGQPAGSGVKPTVQKVAISDVHGPLSAPALDPVGRRINVDQAMIDSAGVIYLYSRQDRNVYRWATGSNRFLSSVPLSGRPNYIAYSPAHHSLYFDSGGNQVRTIPLDGANFAEYPFYASSLLVDGLQSAGNYILLAAGSSTWLTHFAITVDGDVASSRDTDYYSKEYVWNPVNSRMYFLRDGITPNDIETEPIGSDGEIGAVTDSPYHSSDGVSQPLRISPDGSNIVLGSGWVYSCSTLELVGALGNNVSDVAWTDGLIQTIRAKGSQTEVQSWSTSSYLLQNSKVFDGLPLRIFRLNNSQFVLVTSSDGQLKFRKLTRELNILSENTGSEAPTRVESDFDGDGFADVVWQNTTTGDRVLWLLNSGVYSGATAVLPHMDPSIEIRAVADFDGDGKPDLVWQNKVTTQTGIWLLKGTTHTELPFSSSGPNWSIVGAGDFDGDSKPDIVWENALTGEHAIWRMDGTSFSGQTSSLPTVAKNWRVVGVGDFTGDGKCDLLWRDQSAGAVAIWAMDRTNYSFAVALPTIAATWDVAQVGDFDGNGSVDILWNDRTTGVSKIWQFNQTTYVATIALPSSGADWMAGTASRQLPQTASPAPATESDFDDDGSSDIIWQNTSTGERAIWLLNKGAYTGRVVSLPSAATSSEINAIADFNADNKPDFITQDLVTGAVSIQLMNGTIASTSQALPSASTTWRIAGAGDFNGDGKPDVLWQNRVSGEHAVWIMNGMTYSGETITLPTVSTNWVIVGIGDFDGDQKQDLLWRDTSTGALAIWLMNGTTYRYAVTLSAVSSAWDVRQVCDFDGDGKVDILWQNNISGDRSIWKMDGTSYSGQSLALPNTSVNWSAGTSILLN